VGDIHGCYRELMELLQKVGYAPRHDNLILVGDLVNKGPHSQQVVAAARAWCEGSFCWVVRGNHDDAALAA
jgi:predicted phosphodiesterase